MRTCPGNPPMKTLQITCRSLMIFVGFALLASWCCMMCHRSGQFAAKASKHATNKEIYEGTLYSILHDIHGRSIKNLTNLETKECVVLKQSIERETSLRDRYRHAMFLPWTSIGDKPNLPIP